MTKVKQSLWALLLSLDILLCTIWLATLYPLGLASRPSGRELVSTYVGEAAHNRRRWALYMSTILDWVAEKLGDDPDHCHRMFIKYRDLDN